MKRAGAKNDGAWYRANKAIGKMTTIERLSLATKINSHAATAAMFAALEELSASVGVQAVEAGMTDVAAWVTALTTKGIPRQLWLGVMTFDTYTKVGDVYKKDHAAQAFAFGTVIRKTVRDFIFGLREVKDVYNLGNITTGNPGGLPDDNPTN